MLDGGNNECSQSVWTWHLGTWFRSECGGAGLSFRLADLGRLFQTEQFCDFPLASTASPAPCPGLQWSELSSGCWNWVSGGLRV